MSDRRTRRGIEAEVIETVRAKSGIHYEPLFPKQMAALSRLERAGVLIKTGSGATFPWLQYRIDRKKLREWETSND